MAPNIKLNRSHSYYLIGSLLESIVGKKFPSNQHLHFSFFIFTCGAKKSIAISAHQTTFANIFFWGKAAIPTTQHYNIVKKKLIALHVKWKALKKTKQENC